MANHNVSHGEVKSICHGLECSPSKNDAHGTALAKASIHPGSRGHNTVGETTSEFKQKVSSARKRNSGYAKGHAQGATQV